MIIKPYYKQSPIIYADLERRGNDYIVALLTPPLTIIGNTKYDLECIALTQKKYVDNLFYYVNSVGLADFGICVQSRLNFLKQAQ